MMEFTFEEAPWEQSIGRLQPGDSIAASQLLTLLEGEAEYTVSDALQALEDGGITIDITGLPKNTATSEAALRLRREEQLVQTGDLLTDLEETDPLRLYLEELAGIPACGDVEALAMDAAGGSETARNNLVNLMLSRVVILAGEYVGYGVLLQDLIQEGGMGMWQGILNWNGDGSFETYADWWIRQYMAKAVVTQARSSGLGQKLRQGMEDYRDVDQRLLAELGRTPTLGEIAEAMHISEEDARVYGDMTVAARTRRMVDAQREEKEESPEDEQAVEDTAYFQSRQRILELLSGLTQTESQLLSLRFGLEGGLPLSPEETGKKLNLTPQQVVEMEANALSKLRSSGE